ncbi:hypothetical protein [Streptomyces sp. NPDC005385]|uniref:hypothetical protein n=1 Tax=Streptomyces sp. NPDC005385 TaxID=3157039 RepID=UPI0033A9989F
MRIVFEPGWEKKLDDAVHDYVSEIARDVYTNMCVTCPVDTGELLADLAWEVDGDSARIGAQSVEHAIYVEEGTMPHVIEAHGSGALYWAGAQHPVKRVNHPGTEATHFMKLALYAAARV